MKNNPLKEKSFDFAIRIVKLYKFLTNNKTEFVISKQLLRSETGIGAKVRKAE
ncbi:MAG TPA: four helix bundle protein [Candidatus Marinimicrobia bacterium]|nr:four helix bundle protein [Candidatus Neomarinimicrobiota bacterium]